MQYYSFFFNFKNTFFKKLSSCISDAKVHNFVGII